MINDWEQLHKEQMRKIVAHNQALQVEVDRLKKLVIYAPDISLKGTHSDEYERGFWDAVEVMKEMQGTQDERCSNRF